MTIPGAHVGADGVTFAVWAPKAQDLSLVIDGTDHPVEIDEHGIGALTIANARAGTRYAWRVNGEGPFPDPRSRYQPDGVHGESEVVDPHTFRWTDEAWTGLDTEDLIIYELHVGTYTQDGTFRAVIDEMPELAALGITAIELLPVAECPGRWNWGYDGVAIYAPSQNYGTPDDLRSLVDAAHGHGIGVILDVVYNHLGPEGNYTGVYADEYLSPTHETSWGKGLNWDGPGSEHVRAWAIDNAVQWITEYHIDGLRLDATHAIVDDSPKHLVQELAEAARRAAGSRSIYLVAEDERRDITRARPVSRGGEGLDAVWADDFHHEIRVLLTNVQENYYARYSGTTVAIADCIQNGFGQEGHGTPVRPDAADPASCFVFCIQNHDQVGNRPFGDRLHHEINADRYRVASAVLLLAPETPLLFMGQEFAASSPFLFFTDHPVDLGKLVTDGRRKEFAGFKLFADEILRETIPDPQADATFLSSKLDLAERESHREIYALYRELIALRKGDIVLRQQDRRLSEADWVTAEMIGLLRGFGQESRLVLANFGNRVEVDLFRFGDIAWRQAFTTGADATLSDGRWTVPARTAVMLTS
jgi:maltooligosyltrehalose trehalohydrolase